MMSQEVNVTCYDFLDYKVALDIQEKAVKGIQQKNATEQLYLLQHNHVITLGRGGNPQNLLIDKESLKNRGVEFFETGRGGDITYHGPGQLVGYPVLQLKGVEKDVRKYLDSVEEVIIRTLKDFEITSSRIPGLTGVWVGDNKIAAIGVRLSRWVTSHGFALNVGPDLRYFQLITPCGISDKGVTSMEVVLNRKVEIEEVSQVLVKHFGTVFKRELKVGHAQ